MQVDPEDLWTQARDLGEDLVDAGADPDKTAKSVAEFLDDLIPLQLLVPGLPGVALEMADGPVFEQAVRWLAKAFKADPEKRAARKAARAGRRAARRARR